MESNSSLRLFDRSLCSYVRDNVRNACANTGLWSLLQPELKDSLADYLRVTDTDDDTEDDAPPVLNDLYELQVDLRCAAGRAIWTPSPQLHRRAIFCVKEIREELTPQDAQNWSARSRRYGRLLERSGLRFPAGSETTIEWIRTTRMYLTAMGKVDAVTDRAEPQGRPGRPPGDDGSTRCITTPTSVAAGQAAPTAALEGVVEPGRRPPEERKSFSPPQLARHLGISPDKVLAWIRSGELEATNLSTKCAGRPRYGITIEAVHQFQARRAVPVRTPSPRRPRRTEYGVTQFF